jgi:outer membrane protein OmpA-like peptidoglycan-associated protein
MVLSIFALLEVAQPSSGEKTYRDLFFDVDFTAEQMESLKHVKVIGVNCVLLLFRANEEGTIRIAEAWIDGQKQIIEKEKESKPPDTKPPEPPPPPPPPKPKRVRLIGMSFDTSKSFILPDAMNGIKGMVNVYNRYPESELLIVGHTDTAGTPDYNDPLSLERAEAVSAYLRDDVDAWLDWYDSKHPWEKRWGKTEDTHMLKSMDDYDDFSKHPKGVVWGYQESRGLSTDNDCGPNTRRQLITDYMAKDGTSLPKGVEVTTHGCGETFPEDPTPDGTPDPDNRRVELFIFPKASGGIQPPPPGKISKPGSTEYPQWKAQTPDPKDFRAGEPLVEEVMGVINMKLYCAKEYTELANVPYTIAGDEWSGTGTTNGEGCLKHEDIPSGEYTLTVGGREETCIALVLDHTREQPQVRFLQ